jgi:hypothetical protein
LKRKTGGIETKDGKNLSIRLTGGASIQFGELPFQKGETFTLSVISEEERALAIGIMSISTEQVYSDLVKTGTGTVSITIPEDGTGITASMSAIKLRMLRILSSS